MFTDEFSFRQFIYLVTFYTVCMIIEYQLGLFDIEPSKPIETYGYVVSIGLYLIKMLPMIIAAPLTYFNILTTLFIFDEKKNKQEPMRIPQETVCFRVVTRGMFPNLVKKNKDMNLSTLKTYESLNYTYEIVTDKELGIEGHDCYEVLVPSDYETKNGAKFKARALQYALERNESKLNYNDWIVHLDEETLLTKRSINGILKFCNDNKHPIGQGVIAYGKGQIVHELNTLADCMRVTNDLGTLRFSLKYFHRTGMYFKGSYVVCKNGVENTVSFDHGLEGSITEDGYFAVKAANMGFTFDWIEGEMLEKSPFNFMDIVRQRRRWEQGMYLIAVSKNLKRDFAGMMYRIRFITSALIPIGTSSFILSIFFPVSFHAYDVYFGRFYEIGIWYMFWFGFRNSYNLKKLSLTRTVAYVITIPIWMRYWEVVQCLSMVWALATPKKGFEIVKKSFEAKL